jgi:hypothetical protein
MSKQWQIPITVGLSAVYPGPLNGFSDPVYWPGGDGWMVVNSATCTGTGIVKFGLSPTPVPNGATGGVTIPGLSLTNTSIPVSLSSGPSVYNFSAPAGMLQASVSALNTGDMASVACYAVTVGRE